MARDIRGSRVIAASALAACLFAIAVAEVTAAPTPDAAPTRGASGPDPAPAQQAPTPSAPPPAPAPAAPPAPPPAPAPAPEPAPPPAPAPTSPAKKAASKPDKASRPKEAAAEAAAQEPPPERAPAEEAPAEEAPTEALPPQEVLPATGSPEDDGALAPQPSIGADGGDISADPGATPPGLPPSEPPAEADPEPTSAAELTATPAVAVDGSSSDGVAAAIPLMIALLLAIVLLGTAAIPAASSERGERSGIASLAHEHRVEVAFLGAVLLLFSAVGFFLSA